jgi:threonine/homoserine/homoserine lactone efflux protein
MNSSQKGKRMPDGTSLTLFLAAVLMLLFIPGPVVIYTITRSLHQGWQAGLVSTAAVGLGDFVHVVAAALGLSALLASSAVMFSVVKYAGAAYLISLGLRTLLARQGHHVTTAYVPMRLTRVFSQGLLVSILNPKTAVFFLALFPQFIDPARGAVVGQSLFLGSLFVMLGVCTNSLYASLAGTIGQWLKGSARFLRAQRYVSGGVYIALGVSAAFSDAGRRK